MSSKSATKALWRGCCRTHSKGTGVCSQTASSGDMSSSALPAGSAPGTSLISALLEGSQRWLSEESADEASEDESLSELSEESERSLSASGVLRQQRRKRYDYTTKSVGRTTNDLRHWRKFLLLQAGCQQLSLIAWANCELGAASCGDTFRWSKALA